MTADSPTVSVVVPTYNRSQFLVKAVRSVLGQSYRNLEIILVDDHSNDDTREAIQRIMDPRLKYIRHEKNRGGSATRNTGIRAETGDYIAFLDDDDEWLSLKVARQLEAIKGHDAVVCASLINGKRVTRHPRNGIINSHELRKGYIGGGTSALMVRASVLREFLFDEALPAGQDWDLIIRIAEKHSVGYIDEPYVIFNDGRHGRITTGSVNASIAQIERRMQVLYKHREYLGSYWFRYHAAGMYLYSIKQRANKLQHILYSVKRCGVIPIVAVYAMRVRHKLLGN